MKIELVLEDGRKIDAYVQQPPQVGQLIRGVDGEDYMVDFKEPELPDSKCLQVQASQA